MTEGSEPVRRGVGGNAKRTKHLDLPQAPTVRTGHGGQGSGNPPGLRRSRNAEDLQLRRIKALDLRVMGFGYREIGVELGVSVFAAHQDVKHMLAQREQESVNKARALEEARLDAILAKAMAIIEKTTSDDLRLKAIDRVVRIVNQRVELTGIKVPVQLNVNVTERTQADIELEELLNEAQARNAATVQELVGDGGENGSAQ